MECIMPVTLGELETQLLAYAQMRQLSTIRSEEVSRSLGTTTTQTRDLLSRLARRKLIARVRRGLYLVPSRIPPGGRWSPDEYLALESLQVVAGAPTNTSRWPH
jgi:predicted transcriptional regulator of viral defense system